MRARHHHPSRSTPTPAPDSPHADRNSGLDGRSARDRGQHCLSGSGRAAREHRAMPGRSDDAPTPEDLHVTNSWSRARRRDARSDQHRSSLPPHRRASDLDRMDPTVCSSCCTAWPLDRHADELRDTTPKRCLPCFHEHLYPPGEPGDLRSPRPIARMPPFGATRALPPPAWT